MLDSKFSYRITVTTMTDRLKVTVTTCKRYTSANISETVRVIIIIMDN